MSSSPWWERLGALPPNVFAVPFGLAGLGIAWRVAGRIVSAPAAVSDALLIVAAVLWSALTLALAARIVREPGAVLARLRDPVISPFMALPPIVALVLAAGLAPHAATGAKVLALAAVLVVVVLGGWLLGQWIAGDIAGAQLHPGYFLPTVAAGFVGAEVLAPMGFVTIAWLCFGIGALSWLLIGSTILNRLFLGPSMPAALLPTLAIQVAPPAVGGSAYFALHDGPADVLSYGFAGYCVLMALVQVRLIPLYRRAPFAVSFWAFTFSYASVATYALQWIIHAQPRGSEALAWLVLSAITAFILAIGVRSARAVRDGTFWPAAPPVPPSEGHLATDTFDGALSHAAGAR